MTDRAIVLALDRALVERGLDPSELDRARLTARRIDSTLGAALVARGAVSEAELTASLAAAYGLPAWDGHVDASLAGDLGGALCWHHLVVPALRRGDRITIAVSEPPAPDLRSELAHAAKAHAIDVVVAADASLSRALDAVFPIGMPEDLPQALARHAPIVGDGWEETLRRARDEGDDSASLRVANMMILSLGRGTRTSIRIELSDPPRVVVHEAGAWAVHPLLAGLRLTHLLAREVAAHLVGMAGLETVEAQGVGFTLIRGARMQHGGRALAVDVDCEPTLRGMTLVISRALDRTVRDEFMPEDDEIFRAIERAEEAAAGQRWDDAHASLAAAAELARRIDGTGRRLVGDARLARGNVLVDQGRLDEASRAYASAADHADVYESSRGTLRLIAAHGAYAAGRFADAESLAGAAFATFMGLYGAPGTSADFAAFELARAQIALGRLDDADRTTSAVREWGGVVGGLAPVHADWLEGLLHNARGEPDLADPALRAASARLDALGAYDGPNVDALLALDLARVAARRGHRGDALQLLERAAVSVEGLPAEHPSRVSIAREQALLKLPRG